MTRATVFIASAILAGVGGLNSAFAADLIRRPVVPPPPLQLPAVSQHNAKIGAFGGSIDGDTGWGLLGAFSVPLHQAWGLQVDGMWGSAGGSSFWGVGGHLFWRNPTQGLVGLYGSWVDWSPIGAEVRKLGLEAEAYHGPWTLSGIVAAQSGDFTGIAGSVTAALYVRDNLRLDATYRLLQGVGNVGVLGVEWQHDTSGLALFANGSWGEGNHTTIIGGVKFYAGPQKSLIRRHREDDPEVVLPLDLFHKPAAAAPLCLQVCEIVIGPE
jgi:hypothetical protein